MRLSNRGLKHYSNLASNPTITVLVQRVNELSLTFFTLHFLYTFNISMQVLNT